MATRSGSIDPSVPLWMQSRAGMTPAEVQETLGRASGLAGLAGTADMRELLKRASTGEDRAVLARDVYVHALRAGIARMTASMRGIEAIVFTGGVGEHSSEIRSLAAAGLEFLGIRLQESRNRQAVGDMDVSAVGAPRAGVGGRGPTGRPDSARDSRPPGGRRLKRVAQNHREDYREKEKQSGDGADQHP